MVIHTRVSVYTLPTNPYTHRVQDYYSRKPYFINKNVDGYSQTSDSGQVKDSEKLDSSQFLG